MRRRDNEDRASSFISASPAIVQRGPTLSPTDSIVYARTAPPMNVVTGQATFGTCVSGATSVQRPNLISGVPVWISDPNVAGGQRINKAAFSVPAGAVQGNLGRNALNGFGATQVDLTLRRRFKLYERLSLQARADFFNSSIAPTSARHARGLARKRRAERRTESAVPDRWAEVGAVGDEAAVLKSAVSWLRVHEGKR